MSRIVLIGIFGAMGALCRLGVQQSVESALGRPSVLGTLIVNLSGAFLVGFFLALTQERIILPAPWRTVGAVGFFGAYTTFSTMMYESVTRMDNGQAGAALLYLGASLVIGLAATYLGFVLGRAV